jgi:hypothetical protein
MRWGAKRIARVPPQPPLPARVRSWLRLSRRCVGLRVKNEKHLHHNYLEKPLPSLNEVEVTGRRFKEQWNKNMTGNKPKLNATLQYVLKSSLNPVKPLTNPYFVHPFIKYSHIHIFHTF